MGGGFVRGKCEVMEYLEESRERQRWEVGSQQSIPGTKVLFCSLPYIVVAKVCDLVETLLNI